MAVQLPLQFEFRQQQNFDSFYPGANAETVAHLKNFLTTTQQQQIFIWGPSGLGKTHLLQACCQLASHELNLTAFYLSFRQSPRPPTSLFDGLETTELVCLDDIHLIVQDPDWETTLFNFYNAHQENQHRLLLASQCAAADLPMQLIDLKTRLGWGLNLKLHRLDEQQILAALKIKAKNQGFTIPDKVGHFLLTHYRRDLSMLWLTLDKIDRNTLSAQRKLTIPFLKEIMAATDGK